MIIGCQAKMRILNQNNYKIGRMKLHMRKDGDKIINVMNIDQFNNNLLICIKIQGLVEAITINQSSNTMKDKNHRELIKGKCNK